ncbi:MAG TPA: SRPBCC family protein, partial [Pseudonocardia sp.]|nr:SRPBCC family protein [Pseudonocardia sp.]
TVLARHPGRRVRALGATAAVLGVATADVVTAGRASRRPDRGTDQETVRAAVTVRRPASEVYAYWRDLERLPTFMTHLREVRDLGAGRSRWTATGPGGTSVSWDAEITADTPDELVAWRSLPGAGVPNTGTVRFAPAPGGRGTEVRVQLQYRPPGRRLGTGIAALLGEEPGQQIRDDLRRFKQVVETGEVVRSEGSPEGVRSTRLLRQRPAQAEPASRPEAS